MAAASDPPQAYLCDVAWYGKGQVKMRTTGDLGQWKDDLYTDPGERQTATGPYNPSWIIGSEPDPVAYVAGSTPSLRARFSVHPKVKTLQVKAESVDAGPKIHFQSPKISVNGKSTVHINLTGQEAVGSKIDNRQITLRWYERVNGGPWRPEPNSTNRQEFSQTLFVSHAKPLDPGVNRPTARRMEYAANLADGLGHANILAIADAIAQDAMSRYANRQEGSVWEGEAAWQVMYTPSICADDAWLMDNALGLLGIWSQVRYVYPQHYSWAGLVGYAPGLNEHRTDGPDNAWLGYVGYYGEWENYEACTFLQKGSAHRYYLGGESGHFETSAIDVLNHVTNNGQNQAWMDEYLNHNPISVSLPAGPPPTY
jgi:hypothetical protein